MNFGRILDRTIQLMRANLRLFLGIAAVPAVAIVAVFLPATAFFLIAFAPLMRGETGPPRMVPFAIGWVLFAIGYLVFPAVFALYISAASYAVTRADLGFPATVSEAFGVAWRRFGRHLWLMFLGSLYVIAPLLACVLAIALLAVLLHFAAGDSAMGLFLVPLIILLYGAVTVYNIVIMLRFSLAYPVCVVEERPAWESLRRSAQLTQGAKGRIFLVLLLIYAIAYVVNMVLMAVLFAVGALGFFAAMAAHVTQGSPAFFVLIGLGVLGYLLILAVTCLLSYAGLTTALGVLYRDQRLRKDGPSVAPLIAGESA
jgi:hypothetical protein